MKRALLIPAILLISFQSNFAQIPELALSKKSANSQMGFVENLGQFADHHGNLLPDVLFQTSGTGPQIFVTTSGLTFVFHQYNSVVADKDCKNNPLNWSKIEMNLTGASIKKENIVVENPLPGISNYYYAHCPQGILNVRTYQKVTIKNIYPGIDWVLNADNEKGLSHDFIVHPEGNASKIKVIYNGTDRSIAIDEKGRMVLHSEYGDIFEGGLDVYELGTGRKLKAAFVIEAKTMHYKIAASKKKEIIVIDPPLQWSMPQSSTDFDYGYAVSAAHDGTGDVLVTGASDGFDFPTLNAYQGTLSGFEDMVVERLNAAGTRLWSTFYGGTDYEQGKGIASDNAGNCYVTGNTGSNDFPVLNPIQTNYGNGVYDAAILKFNSAGVRQWATWYGSFGNDYGNAIAADGAGNIYVAGYTNSAFFVTLNPIQATKNTGYDGFIMKLNSSSVLQWATYYGGDDDDKMRAIAIDNSGGNIFITGSTLSGSFPTTGGVFQTSSASAYTAEDAFILKMSAAQVVQFCTYNGGNDADFGQGITVDNNNNIFITGYTLSSVFPLLSAGPGAYFDGSIGSVGTHDAFITECNANGTARIWSTYFGGTSPDMGFAIASDPFVGIYICGNTASIDFPLHQPVDNNYYQSVHGDGGSFNDMFIAWFDVNDSLRWSTYYGDANGNEAYGICVDTSNNIFVTGVDNNNLAMLKFNPGVSTSIPSGPYFQDIFIYPNPVAESLSLHFSSFDEGDFSFEFVNLQGQILARGKKRIVASNWNSVEFDVKDLAKGPYFLKIYLPDGKFTVKSFIKS